VYGPEAGCADVHDARLRGVASGDLEGHPISRISEGRMMRDAVPVRCHAVRRGGLTVWPAPHGIASWCACPLH
jgi:hypothetical protein